MPTTPRQFGLLLGLATAFHAVLFLVAACLLALGVFRQVDWTLPAEVPAPEEDSVVIVVEPEVAAPELEPAKPKRDEAIRFVRTNGQETAESTESEAPKFISDRTTHAASATAADPNGDVNLPNQKGHDSPVLDLVDRQFAEGEYSPETRAQTGPMQESAPPTPQPQPIAHSPPQTSAPPPELPPTVDPLSDLKTREPVQTPKETVMRDTPFEKLFPEEPAPKVTLQDRPKARLPTPPTAGSPGAPRGQDPKAAATQTMKNTLRGAITNHGPAAVEAAGTAQGKYLSQVETAISQRFTPACMRARDRITYGTVEVEFDLNLQGSVENLRITNQGKSNPLLQDLVLGVILEAKLPPIPKELFDYLIGNRLHITYGFLFH